MTKNATSANNDNGKAQPSDTLPQDIRYTFSKTEKLCSRRSFDLLFEDIQSFHAGKLWVAYSTDLPPELVTAPLMVAFAVPKRSFKRAVHRNLIKRRLREAFRLNKAAAVQYFREKDRHVAFLIKYNSREIRSFKEIEKDLRYALRRLQKLV